MEFNVAKVRILIKIYSSKNGENLMKFNVVKVRILMRLWFSRRVQKNPSVRVAQLRF